MTTGMIIIAVVAVIIAFAACANAAGANATNVATSAEKSSKIGNQIAAYNIHEESTEGFYCFGQDSIAERIMKAMSDRSDKIDFMRKSLRKANVLTRAELEKRIGMDIVESMKGLDPKGQSELAKRIEDNIVLFIKSTNPNIAKVRNEELLNEPIAVDTFRAVVVAWLINVALFLSFGRVRYEAIRDAWNIRNNLEHSSFEYIRRLLMKNISAINAQMKCHTVDDVIDRMEKVIDRDAMGSQSVVANKEIYKRKIEPRLQQYWKKVKEAFRMKQEDVDARLDEIHRKYGDFSEAIADIKDGKGSEGIVPTEEKLLERDMAQLEYVALTRYGALAEKNLGEVSDKVDEVVADISLARRRLEVGYPLRMMAWSRSKIFKEFKWKAWGELYDDAMLIAEYGSSTVCALVGAKMSADLIDFYDDDELLVQSIGAVVARRALKSSDFEEVPGALEEAYHTIDVVFSREFRKREGQRLLWQLIRGDAYCCSPMLDFAYEKVVSLLERSEKLKCNRILWERKRAEERAKFSYRLGRLVGKIINWFG